jgi:hypothetical protein
MKGTSNNISLMIEKIILQHKTPTLSTSSNIAKDAIFLYVFVD